MTGTTLNRPTCPTCGYDFAGVAATWETMCPLAATCSECGVESPTVALFHRESLGPRWSFEHASRRWAIKWLSTTMIALRPGTLWKELQPDHRLFPRRLRLMAVLWVALVHLVCGGVLGLSWLSIAIFAPDHIVPWHPSQLREWWFWRDAIRGMAWPYNKQVAVPLSASRLFSTSLYIFFVFITTSLFMMGAIVFVCRRRAGPGVAHFARPLVLILPSIAVWTVVVHIAFAVGGHLAFPGTHDWAAGVVALGGFIGFAVYTIWWWRCFAAHYLGDSARSWVLLPLGLLALAIGVVVAVSVDVATQGRI